MLELTTAARTRVLGGILLTVVFLAGAALLTPDQNPILPIELSAVLVLLAGWFGLRKSRAALVAITVFCTLLVLLSAHIITGDLGSSGANELVPDFLILGSGLFVVVSGVAALRRLTLARRA
ncbi:MAG TPA: hypothetical protein VF049_02915 [Nocardioidaceae bacterium]|jgi:hypothetical protein